VVGHILFQIVTRDSTMQALREQFLLDPTVTFLNHGSFGATPRPVFAAYRRWQRRLERQPVLFLGRQLPALLGEARRALGGTLGADPAELVLLPNATFGVNLVARSLHLGRGDEILTTDHEYGACDKTWRFLCLQSGASYCRRPIPLPVSSPGQLVDGLWDGVTPRTRLIFVSHITSPTALTMPVAEICARARAAGILTLIDGAHAPGQLPLDLHAIDADFYVGNLHKWALAPKGAAFLYARPDRQPLLEPLVVSWGWSEEWSLTGTSCVDLLQWWGTVDPAASLSVPAAIRFQEEHDWPAVRRCCHELATGALRRLGDLTGLDPLYPPGAVFYQQMVAAPLPPSCNPAELQARLYGQHRIEIPCLDWNGRPLIRLSVQGYNSEADIDALLAALEVALPGARA
jgi:isopenicillin-N epimerase